MPRFSVIADLCRQDGICASVCPAHVIKGPKGQTPFMRPGGENTCIGCGHCMAFCPHGAARIDTLPVDDMRRIARKALPDAESAELLLASRRSIRHFKKEPVPRELLARVLASDRFAPSAKNARPVRWVMVYEQATMRAVGDAAATWLEAMAADTSKPPLIAEARALAKAWRMGIDPLFRGAPHLVLAVTRAGDAWAAIDAAVALTYLELAALPHNIGACWAGYISTAVSHYKPLRDMLGLADNETTSGGQMLGFIALKPTATAPRNPLPVEWR